MRIVLDAVAKGRAQRALPATSTSFETGRATLVVAETEQRPTVLGLVASGRMKVDSGTVTIDGRTDAGAIRRRVALVDAPVVSEPEPNVTVTGVVDAVGDRVESDGSRGDHLAHDRVAVVEVVVQGATRQAGAAGDRGDRGAGVVADGRGGGIDDAGAVLDGVTATRGAAHERRW